MDAAELGVLVDQAREVAGRAYVPASGFRVGAAVVADDGRVFVGCNVENASYGLTSCAERNAVFRAVAEGARQLVQCVIFTDTDEPTFPCGACRQVLAEFAAEMEVVLATSAGVARRLTLDELLPEPFRF